MAQGAKTGIITRQRSGVASGAEVGHMPRVVIGAVGAHRAYAWASVGGPVLSSHAFGRLDHTRGWWVRSNCSVSDRKD